MQLNDDRNAGDPGPGLDIAGLLFSLALAGNTDLSGTLARAGVRAFAQRLVQRLGR